MTEKMGWPVKGRLVINTYNKSEVVNVRTEHRQSFAYQAFC